MKRKYGLPFRGYVSSRARHMIQPDEISADSRDYMLDAQVGRWVSRRGSEAQTVGGVKDMTTFASSPQVAIAMRRIMAFSSASFVDGFQSHLALLFFVSIDNVSFFMFWDTNSFTVAATSTTNNSDVVTTATANGFEDVSVGSFLNALGAAFPNGAYVLALNSTTSLRMDRVAAATVGPTTATFTGAHRMIGDTGFSATHYPANFKMVPFVGGEFGYNRCQTTNDRRRLAGGSRSLIQVGDDAYFPGYLSMPGRWSRKFNSKRSSGTEKERIFPWGQIPALWPPTLTFGAADPDGSFESTKYAYVSVVFRWKDGSYSRPFLPRGKNPTLTAGLGLVQVTGAAGERRRTVSLSNIPKGPDGVDQRLILRTPWAATVDELSASELSVWEVLNNNTLTTLVSTKGNDLELDKLLTPLAVRFDLIWPPPARYVWSGDHRAFTLYTKTHPGAIILAPFQNNDDDTTGATVYTANLVAGTSLTLKKGALTTVLAATAAETVEKLVDLINATTDSGANGGKWVAQMVPNADGTTTCDNLASTTTTDFGDGGGGVMRCYSNAYPGVLYFNPTTQASFPEQKRRLFFSIGGPGVPAHSINSFAAGNYRTAPESAGFGVGGAPLLDGQVVCFSRGIYKLRNIRDGKTGIDDDYRLEPLNENRGCLDPGSIVAGDGWVGYMTRDGYVVTDGDQEILISDDLLSTTPEGRLGDLAEVVNLLEIESNKDDSNGTLFASALTGRLYLSYVKSGTRQVHVYDYSAGVDASGLIEMLASDKRSRGWSAPVALPIGPICEVGRPAGIEKRALAPTAQVVGEGFGVHVVRLDFGNYDQWIYVGGLTGIESITNINPGTSNILISAVFSLGGGAGAFKNVAVGAAITGTGITPGTVVLSKTNDDVLVMSKPATVAGTAFLTFLGRKLAPVGYCVTDLITVREKKSVQRATVLYAKRGKSGFGLTMGRDHQRQTERFLPLDSTAAGALFDRKVQEMPVAMRAGAEVVEFGFRDDIGEEMSEFWGLEAEIDLLDSYV